MLWYELTYLSLVNKAGQDDNCIDNDDDLQAVSTDLDDAIGDNASPISNTKFVPAHKPTTNVEKVEPTEPIVKQNSQKKEHSFRAQPTSFNKHNKRSFRGSFRVPREDEISPGNLHVDQNIETSLVRYIHYTTIYWYIDKCTNMSSQLSRLTYFSLSIINH